MFKLQRLLLVGWIIPGLLTGCRGEEPPITQNLRPVRYQQMFSTGGERVRSFSGVAKAGTESRLSFRVSGTVQEVPVEVGDVVRRGQLLARLDSEDYEILAQEAEATLARARAEARNAEAEYQRMRLLYENRNASKSELDASRARAESAQAQVRSAEKRLEASELQLRYTRLLAPTAGAVAEVNIEVNESAQAGQKVVMITAGSEIDVLLSIPSALISGVHEGDPVQVTFDALGGREFEAVVTEVGVTASRGTTTYPVTAKLSGKEESVKPGMSANASFRFARRGGRERYLVPPGSVGEDRRGRFVFLLEDAGDGTGVVRRREVQVGELTGEGLEVLSGISDGELLVTAGVSKLTDGGKVRVPETP